MIDFIIPWPRLSLKVHCLASCQQCRLTQRRYANLWRNLWLLKQYRLRLSLKEKLNNLKKKFNFLQIFK